MGRGGGGASDRRSLQGHDEGSGVPLERPVVVVLAEHIPELAVAHGAKGLGDLERRGDAACQHGEPHRDETALAKQRERERGQGAGAMRPRSKASAPWRTGAGRD